MSVLVKGIEMPKNCYDCPFIRASVAGDFYCVAGDGIEEDLKKLYERRMSDCPLVDSPEPHWIPVTERLPKEDGNYLVSGKWGSGKEAVGDCLFSVEDGYFQTAWNFDVLAWCELPEPYKKVTK